MKHIKSLLIVLCCVGFCCEAYAQKQNIHIYMPDSNAETYITEYVYAVVKESVKNDYANLFEIIEHKQETNADQGAEISLRTTITEANNDNFKLSFLLGSGTDNTKKEVVTLNGFGDLKKLIQTTVQQMIDLKYKPKPKVVEPQSVSKEEVPQSRNNDSDLCVFDTKLGFQALCHDLPQKMTWYQAKTACPSGFRLPTISELQSFCKTYSPNYHVGFGFVQIKVNKASKTYNGLTEKEYWSSSTDRKGNPLSITTNDGEQEGSNAENTNYVRCVCEQR